MRVALVPVLALASAVLSASGATARSAAGAAGSRPAASRPVARVNGEAITPEAFKREFVRLHGGHAKFLAGESEIRAFLAKMIDRVLLIQEASRIGLDQLPEVQSAVDAYAEEKAVAKLVEGEIADRAKVSEEEIHSAWAAHTGELYQVRQVVVPTREEAEDIYVEVRAGADLEEIARSRSIAASRTAGGILPRVGWGGQDPEWEDVVFPLAPAEVSPPFRSREGWEVAQMLSCTAAERPDYARARSAINGILHQRKLESRKKAFASELWARYGARLTGGVPDLVELEALRDRPAGAAAATVPDRMLATWEGGSLDLATFAQELDLKPLSGLSEPRRERQIEDLVRQTVNDFLVRREARARGLADLPEVAGAVRQRREMLIEQALYADYVLKGLAVGEEEIRAWYDAHRSELVTPERRRVSQIVVASRDEAEEIRTRLLSGESFPDLAKARSTDGPSARNGGDLGWVSKKEVPPGFEPVLGISVGEVGEPIQSGFGWHLFRVEEVVPPRPLTLDAARPEIEKRLEETAKTERRAEWIRKLRAAATIRIDRRTIRALAEESRRTVGSAPTQSGASGPAQAATR